MKTNRLARRSSLILVVLFAFGFRAQAQVPAASANADIVKMIEAGLPEAVILNKIHSSAGSFDTSTDALITLKKAGATDAELTAISAPIVAPVSSHATPVPPEPVEAFGAQLLRSRFGDPYLQFQSAQPEVFPNGLPSNTAYLVLYKGEVAVLVPSSRLDEGSMDCHPFNALFLRDRIAVDRYIGNSCIEKATIPQNVSWPNLDEYPKARLTLVQNLAFRHGTFKKVGSHDQLAFTDGNKVRWSDQVVFGMFPIHCDKSSALPMRADSLSPFIDRLMSDFDKTVADFQRAAGITDPTTQLSAHAHYTPVTLAQASMYRDIFNQRWKEGEGNSNGWLTALNAMQGVSNIQQAMAEGKIADANHDVAGQINAAIDGGRATVGTVNGTAVAPSSPGTASAPQQTQPGISPVGTPAAAGGVMYNGPNAEWVRIVLATAGPYSCTPAGKVRVPATFSCQRDGEIYKAQALAWGSECSEQTGFHDDAVKIASTLVQTLQTAKRLCGAQAPTGAVHCDTDRILTCSQLPN